MRQRSNRCSRYCAPRPTISPSILLAGAVRSALGSSQQAEQHLKKFLGAYPRHLYATKLLASLQLRANLPEVALDMVRPLLIGNADDVELLTLAGEASMRLRHFSGAAEYFEKASALRPDAPLLHTALALSQLGNGDSGRAVGELERAASQDRTSTRTGVLLVMTYLRSNNPDKAMATIAEMQKLGDNPDALALPAQIQCADENLAACAETYTRLVGLVPGSAAPHMRLATVQLRLKDQAGAESSLRKVLSMQPDLLEAQMTLLNVLIGQNKFAEALLLASKAQKRHPESSTGYKLEGDVLSAQAKAVPALKAYERAFALERKGPQLIQLHDALVKAGNASEADARMALWLRDHPSDVATRMYYASSKLVKNDNKAVILQLEAVLKLDPKNVVALNDLAWSYQRIGDKHALAYAERAADWRPTARW